MVFGFGKKKKKEPAPAAAPHQFKKQISQKYEPEEQRPARGPTATGRAPNGKGRSPSPVPKAYRQLSLQRGTTSGQGAASYVHLEFYVIDVHDNSIGPASFKELSKCLLTLRCAVLASY
jgi:hypothetical protein